MASISVIVVSYNTREKLRRCLSRIEREHEVIVVDNGSTDGSGAMVQAKFPHVRLVEAGENLGFGRANNRGGAIASGELLLFLNSDCYAEPGAITKLSLAFADETVSGAGGRLLNADGSIQNSTARRMTLQAVLWEQTFLERLLPVYWTTARLAVEIEMARQEGITAPTFLTEQVMGACLMCRREGFPGFDERFFLYMEDTMLCDALRERGEILYVPDALFTHELGASSSAEWWRGVARYNAGKELYFYLTQGRRASRACFWLDRLGALLRVVVKPTRAKGFLRVLREPWRAEDGAKGSP